MKQFPIPENKYIPGTSIKVIKTAKTDSKTNQKIDNDNLYAGYCLRNDGTVYGTIHKNNCLENEEITFEQYTNYLNNSSDFSNSSDKDIEEKLIRIKKFYEEGLITKEEYDNKRLEILDAF